MPEAPGETEAIETVIRLGREHGFQRMINALKNAWTDDLIGNYQIPKNQADHASGWVCPKCCRDLRTGEVVAYRVAQGMSVDDAAGVILPPDVFDRMQKDKKK